MGYICSVAIRIDDQDDVNENAFEEELEITSPHDVKPFLAEYEIDDVSLVIQHNKGYGNKDMWKNLTTDLAYEIQECAKVTAQTLGHSSMLDIYMDAGFGNKIDAISGEKLGWQFYIAGDGYIEESDVLEQKLMDGSPHFKAIREYIERIFNSKTSVLCLIIG